MKKEHITYILESFDYDDIEEPQKNCSVAEILKGGTVSYSNEGLEGSVLTYHCNSGYYPYPVSTRVCNSRGEWSVMTLPNGKLVTTARCKGKHVLFFNTVDSENAFPLF